MLQTILRVAIERRGLIIFGVLLFIGLGVWNYQRLPIDAVPDITNVQVQINTEAAGYSPLEVEQRITYTIENSLSGLPGLAYTRSLSRYGLSQVTAVLFCAFTGQRTTQSNSQSNARRYRARYGTNCHRPGRNF